MNTKALAITSAVGLAACAGQPDRTVSSVVSRSLAGYGFQEYLLPAGSGPHDVAPAPDGSVWYTAQAAGRLGNLDPISGDVREIPLGARSAPHGVIVGPDGAPWVTDGGLNAIVRVDPITGEPQVFPLPPERPNANLNTATFDLNGLLWFTGQNGVYGRLDPWTGALRDFHHGLGAGLLRIPCRKLRRPDRLEERRRNRPGSSHRRPGRAPRLARLARSDLGERVERRPSCTLRPRNGRMAGVAPSRFEATSLCGIRR